MAWRGLWPERLPYVILLCNTVVCFFWTLWCTIPCDSHTIYFIDDEDDEAAGDDIDGDEWSD